MIATGMNYYSERAHYEQEIGYRSVYITLTFMFPL